MVLTHLKKTCSLNQNSNKELTKRNALFLFGFSIESMIKTLNLTLKLIKTDYYFIYDLGFKYYFYQILSCVES